MRSLILLLLLAASAFSHAQNALELDPVTIISSRAPQKITETGRSISVWEGKLFRQLPVHSIDELLKYIPGVEVQSRGPMGAQSDIVIRGGTFQQVLVLLDGIKLNDPITGHFSSYIPVAPYEIERIEVLRGPAAAVYGSEAVGGVINIITKVFNRFVEDKATTATAALAAGEYGFVNGNLGMHTTGPKINASIGAYTNNATGQFLRGTNRGYFHNHTLSGSIAFRLKNDWQLSVRTGFDSRDFAAQNFYTTFLSDTATEKVESWWNQLQLKKQGLKYTHQFDLVYKHSSDHYLYNPASVANDNKSGFWVLQYIHSHKLSGNSSGNLGAVFDRREITSNDRGDHDAYHGAIFGSLLYNKNKWRISPGLRLDWDENYGTALLPQLNTSYQWSKLVVRAAAGRAIRGADFTERYNNYNKPRVVSGSIGDPNLSAENSWSYEAGLDMFLGTHFKVSMTGFWREQNDVIDFVSTPYEDMPRKDNLVPGSTYALAKNLRELSTRGIDLELVYKKQFSANHQFFMSTGLSFLKSVSDEPVPSFYILSHAKTLIQSNLVYTAKHFTLAINGIYKKRNAQTAPAIEATITPDYFLLNGKLSCTIWKIVTAHIAINNITDIEYSDLLGSIMPRRWTTAGISVAF